MVLDEGEIVIELDRKAAPHSIATILELIDEVTRGDATAEPTGRGYYDGLTIDYTWPRIEIGTTQDGRLDYKIPQEMDAEALGLHQDRIKNVGEAMDIWQFELSKADGQWKRQGTRPPKYARWLERFEESGNVDFLVGTSRQEINEILGYRYISGVASRRARRGNVYLHTRSPADASPGMMILLADRPQLDGRVTVIGEVVEGLDLAEEISIRPIQQFRGRPTKKPVDPVIIQRIERLQMPG